MIKSGGKMHPRTSAWRARVGKSVRPGVEALLLAAVALGCAQAGWGIVTPNAANALSDVNTDEATPEPIVSAQTYSPFAPHTIGGSTHAMAALLSSVQLNGVRMSLDPALTCCGAPERVRAAGLQAGDLVISINGARPGDLASALAAAQSGALRLEIERDGAPMALTLEMGAPA